MNEQNLQIYTGFNERRKLFLVRKSDGSIDFLFKPIFLNKKNNNRTAERRFL